MKPEHILSLSRSWADEATYTLKIDPRFYRELIGKEEVQINRLQDRNKVLIFFFLNRYSEKTTSFTAKSSSASAKPSSAASV